MTHKLTGDQLLTTDPLARVEGEGAMTVRVRGGSVTDVELRIFEPPRFFEAFLRGRAYTEPPDITARICGICPVAYQMSSCLAIEQVCGVRVDGPLRDLRRLLYCGEWIESHALHIYLLHAPDFLGFDGVVDMAPHAPEAVERGLRLKRVGNEVMTLVGGRSIHPVNVRVGGFYRVPTRAELRTLREPLLHAREDALETVRWVSGFDFPDFEQHQEYLALRSPDSYAIEGGSFVSSSGIAFESADFDLHVREEHVARSNALHARLHGVGSYVVGPMARYTINHDALSPLALEAAAAAGLGATCRNPFRSIIVRAVELVYACDEALRIVAGWEPPSQPAVEVTPRAGVGTGATEAPRGVIWHRYRLAGDGTIRDARIVPPTSQNQASIEEDMRSFVQDRLDLPTDELTRQCEQAIRNYDPCISCATHFLHLHVERA